MLIGSVRGTESILPSVLWCKGLGVFIGGVRTSGVALPLLPYYEQEGLFIGGVRRVSTSSTRDRGGTRYSTLLLLLLASCHIGSLTEHKRGVVGRS